MPSPITMPKYGMTTTEDTVARWSVADGDCVKKEQLIAEIETDKLVNDLEAPATGTLANIIRMLMHLHCCRFASAIGRSPLTT